MIEAESKGQSVFSFSSLSPLHRMLKYNAENDNNSQNQPIKDENVTRAHEKDVSVGKDNHQDRES